MVVLDGMLTFVQGEMEVAKGDVNFALFEQDVESYSCVDIGLGSDVLENFKGMLVVLHGLRYVVEKEMDCG